MNRLAFCTLARPALAAVLLASTGCGGGQDQNTPTPASQAAPQTDVTLIPPVLSETQKLAVALAKSAIAAGDLPPGATAAAGVRTLPSRRTREFHAESKVTFDVMGANDSDKVSYTVYPTREDAVASFATIGEAVPGRTVTGTEKIVMDAMTQPAWGETSTEKYEDKTIARSSVATISGSTIVLAQSIAVSKDGLPPVAAVDYALTLLKGGVLHLEKLAPAAGAAPAAVTN